MIRTVLVVLIASVFCGLPGALSQSTSVPVQAASPTADLTGKWHFVFQTEGGDRENEADFKVQGEQVTGKWNSTDVKGTFKDGSMDLAFPYNSDEAGMTATLKLKGKLANDKLSGTWEFGDYSGTFNATRR